MIKTIISLLVIMMMMGTAAAIVEEDWPLGVTNTHADPHVLVDFEEGTASYNPIVCPVSGITFVTMGGTPWVYACMDGQLNLRNETSGTGPYVVNGYAGAWCGQSGNGGKVTFDDPVSHVSCLASISTNLLMVAYDSNDNEVVNSSWATSNGGEHNFTRLSVDRFECDISYVIIHDAGNYWLIDDLVTTRTTTFSIGDAFNNDTIPIVVKWAENAGAIDITLSYNASIVTVTGVADGDMNGTFWNLENDDKGWIRIGAYSSAEDGLSDEFILANITFAPVSDGVCPLEITVTTFKDATVAGNSIPYKVNNGTYSSYRNGDVNGDGEVDMFDAMYLAKYTIGQAGFGMIIEQTADVDGNGIIDIHDASRLAKCIIGIPGWCPLE